MASKEETEAAMALFVGKKLEIQGVTIENVDIVNELSDDPAQMNAAIDLALKQIAKIRKIIEKDFSEITKLKNETRLLIAGMKSN
jgi:hypothetical protein